MVLLYAIDYKDYILSHKVSYNLKLLCEVDQNKLNRTFLYIFNFLYNTCKVLNMPGGR